MKEEVFRHAEKKDTEAILAMYRKCVAQGEIDGSSDWDEEYPSRETIDFDLSVNGLYVLEQEGEIVAAISLVEHDDLDELEGWQPVRSCVPARLCVLPERRGMGIARRMVEAMLREARENGFQATRHLSSKSNLRSTALYQKMGFRRIGETHLYDTDFWMFEMLL